MARIIVSLLRASYCLSFEVHRSDRNASKELDKSIMDDPVVGFNLPMWFDASNVTGRCEQCGRPKIGWQTTCSVRVSDAELEATDDVVASFVGDHLGDSESYDGDTEAGAVSAQGHQNSVVALPAL